MPDYGVNHEQAINAAIMLQTGGVGEVVVGGLNKLKPYGITGQVGEVNEFRKPITSNYVGTKTLSTSTYGGNDLGDDVGQALIRGYILNSTKLTDVRLYRNLTDFIMADIGSDPESTIQFSKHDVGEADPNGVYEFTGELVYNGAPATFTIHNTTSTMVIAPDVGGDTITDVSATFVTDGCLVGDTIILEGVTESADDYTQHVITAVTETEIVTDSIDTLTAQLTGSEFTLHCGRF